MNIRYALWGLCIGWLAVWSAEADTQILARVNADRVNLRARPDQQSETVSQVGIGDALAVRSIQDAWIEIVPPESVDFWVHREFIVDDIVVVNRLNVRSGAGINYNVVGSYSRGETIKRRGSFGEWLKVSAPSDASLWVSRDLVELIYPPVPAPAPEAAPPVPPPAMEGVAASSLAPPPPESALAPDEAEEPAPAFVFDVPAEPVRPSIPPPSDLRLIPLDGQGREVQREGLLKRSPTLLFNAPGSHRLVKREGNKLITTAYLRGNAAQLNALIDRHLLIRGREYWVEDVKAPVIVIETIEKRTFF
ncbi:MAG TPA: SH3 domain-containing protein [Kiritimatiellia bacterium]|nr:SH3 domain-containing protein [Kiritimatiellia bacterium]HMO99253.1 SH3 domain-containing protein [Kiritimatiellia bacterium]HMP96955.1 SH3 domain-containing protein [Kiritimatiellia bacterium]